MPSPTKSTGTFLSNPSNISKLMLALLGAGALPAVLDPLAARSVTESLGADVAGNNSITRYPVTNTSRLPALANQTFVDTGERGIEVTMGGPWANATHGDGHHLVMPAQWSTTSMDTVYLTATPATGNASVVQSTVVFKQGNTTTPAVLIAQFGETPATNFELPVAELCTAVGDETGIVVSTFPDGQFNIANFTCTAAWVKPSGNWAYAIDAGFNTAWAGAVPNDNVFAGAYTGFSFKTRLYPNVDYMDTIPVFRTASGVAYFDMTPPTQIFNPDASLVGFFITDTTGNKAMAVPVAWRALNYPITMVNNTALASTSSNAAMVALLTSLSGATLFALWAVAAVYASRYPKDERPSRNVLIALLIGVILTNVVPPAVIATQLPAMDAAVPQDGVMVLANTSFSALIRDYFPGLAGVVKLVGFYPQMIGMVASAIGIAWQMNLPKSLKRAELDRWNRLLAFDLCANELPVACYVNALLCYCVQVGVPGAIALSPLVMQLAVNAYSKHHLKKVRQREGASAAGKPMLNKAGSKADVGADAKRDDGEGVVAVEAEVSAGGDKTPPTTRRNSASGVTLRAVDPETGGAPRTPPPKRKATAAGVSPGALAGIDDAIRSGGLGTGFEDESSDWDDDDTKKCCVMM
jgi:hypothetical protein